MHRLVLPSAFCAWLSTEFLGLGEPASEIGGDKVIVNEPWIGMGYAGNLGGLTGGESFVRVEARGGGEEALAAERFVDARETAGKLMGGIEERGVGVGQGGVAVEPSGVEARTEAGAFEVGEEADGSVGPDAPLAEEAAVDVARAPGEGERSEEVGEDVVVVAGVEGNVVTAGSEDGADDVECAVAVEGGDFDGDKFRDVGERAPERVTENAAADGGLQIETEEWNLSGYGATVGEDFFLGVGGGGPGAEAEEACVIAESTGSARFREGLRGATAEAGDERERARLRLGASGVRSREPRRGGFGREAQDGFIECDVGIADGELGGVNADGKSAGTGVEVVADEGALVRFVPAAAAGERERKRGDELASAEVGAEGGREHGGDGGQGT